MDSFLKIVRGYNKLIRNGRQLPDISAHMRGEHVELEEEIEKHLLGQPQGADGIVGESIDVIACALDLIFEVQPDITDEELCQIMEAKCAKWARKYS